MNKTIMTLLLLGLSQSLWSANGRDIGVEPQALASVQSPDARERMVMASTQAVVPVAKHSFEPKMLSIPEGRFRMGDLTGAGEGNERPVHEVTVQAFRMSQTEVTVAQFRTFVEATGYRTDAEKNSGGNQGCNVYNDEGAWSWRANTSWRDPGFAQAPDHPVVCVSWDDAKAYIQWLGQATGKAYRLPTEAEWEYAARAGSESRYGFGDDGEQLCDNANLADQALKAHISDWPWSVARCEDKAVYTAPVGRLPANAFGLQDMHGNAWEWTEDHEHDSYHGAPSDGSAWLSRGNKNRLVRGGSWGSGPGDVRSATRYDAWPGDRDSDIGFRIAGDY